MNKFEDIFDESELLETIDSKFKTFCKLIELKFPKYSCKNQITGSYPSVHLVDRPLKDGLGWTKHLSRMYRLGDVEFSKYIDGLDDVHFDSVIAHEAAHVAAYNELCVGDVESNINEWKSTKGHTKVWHEIVDKLNSLKLKSGEKAFDIVEKLDNNTVSKYFPCDCDEDLG